MRAFVLLSLVALPVAAQADDTVFSCITASGKQVRVVQTDNHVRYTFGRPGQAPEMKIETPTAELEYHVSAGSQIESHVMSFRNGRTIYLVGASILYSNPDWGGEITVLQGDEQLAHILCRDGTVEFSADRLATEPAGS
ncbi:hypothetical protein WCE34_02080 [Luteimonas sp. MJ204]|uniref:hypothetical protein n=1 Tax=Luteimonas sp. MJ145 TaxID=3129234 RepID=UPI0031BA1AFF